MRISHRAALLAQNILHIASLTAVLCFVEVINVVETKKNKIYTFLHFASLTGCSSSVFSLINKYSSMESLNFYRCSEFFLKKMLSNTNFIILVAITQCNHAVAGSIVRLMGTGI